jgi:adenylosuccinate lyase
LPEAFLCADELLALARKIVEGLRVDERRIAANLRTYGPFAGSEAVLMEAVKSGGDRQALHASLRDAAMRAYDRMAAGGDNALAQYLVDDERLTSILDPAEIRALLDPTDHIGDAPERALALAARVKALAPFPRPRTLAESTS